MKVSNRTVLITGGSRGIGRALVEAFAKRRNQVIACSRSCDTINVLAKSFPSIDPVEVDLSRTDELDDLVAQIAARYGRLDILVNNAGVQYRTDFTASHIDVEAIWQEMVINLLAPIRITARCMPLLLQGQEAAIVNMISILAVVPKARASVYSATKAGLSSFSKALRSQLNGTSIRVFECIPPLTDTHMTATHMTAGINSKPKVPPACVAEDIVRAIQRNHYRYYGGSNRYVFWANKFMPSIVERFVS